MIKFTIFPEAVPGKEYNSSKGKVFTVSDLQELNDVVHQYGWAPSTFEDNHRVKKKFKSCDLIGLDVDGEISFNEAKKLLDKSKMQYIINFSRNHGVPKVKEGSGEVLPACDRFRVIIPLDKTIKDSEDFQATWGALNAKFQGRLDQACKDNSRFFYPSSSKFKEDSVIEGNGDFFKVKRSSNKPKVKEKKEKPKYVESEDFQRPLILHGDVHQFLIDNTENFNVKLNKAMYALARSGIADKESAMRLLQVAAPDDFRNHESDMKTINSAWAAGQESGEFGMFHKLQGSSKNEQARGIKNALISNFKEKFHVLEDQREARSMILREVRDKLVKHVSFEAVSRATGFFLEREFNEFLNRAQRDVHTQNWLDFVNPLKAEPVPVAFKDEDIFCYRKLDFSPEEGECPLFDDFLNRTYNSDALMCFIWSLFEPDADRSQYIWLYGSGGEGKTSLVETIARVLGEAYTSESTNNLNSQFFNSTLLGKRLCNFGDTNSFRAPTTGKFKELTGGDYTRIEFKGRDSFMARLWVKFIFCSNNLPAINNNSADLRRLILCESLPYDGPQNPNYKEDLWKEMPHILWKCKNMYYSKVKDHGVIPCDLSKSKDLANDSDLKNEMIFNSCLEYTGSKDDIVQRNDLYEVLVPKIGQSPKAWQSFKDYLTKQFGVSENSRHEGKRVFKKIKIKEF